MYNSKVDAFTHQLDGAMPLYVSFRRARRGHTTIWYEPLEEENVGHGGYHEVTGDVYKHTTAPAQRRLSIERTGWKPRLASSSRCKLFQSRRMRSVAIDVATLRKTSMRHNGR